MDAPQFSKGEIALFVDVRDNQADGIHMRGKHDLGSGTFFMDNEIAQGVDGGTVYDRELFELLRTLAERGHIPWQTKEFLSGGTDASAIQRTKEGVRVAAISAAVRYLHTPSSVASLEDCQNILILARRFLQAVATME